MKLFRIASVADEVMEPDPEWMRTVYQLRGCGTCGYLRNDQRTEPLDLVLNSESDDASARVVDVATGGCRTEHPTAPFVGVWCVGCHLLRTDLVQDLQLCTGGCTLGSVSVGEQLLADYRSVVLHSERWVFGINRPLTAGKAIAPCKECGRLGMRSAATKTFVVKESLQREGNVLKRLKWPNVFDLLGTELVVTDQAVSRIRPSILKELEFTEIEIISLNKIDMSTGVVTDL